MIGCGFAFIILMHDAGWLFSVNSHMLFQISTLTKAFAADFADVRSFARVQPRMNNHFIPLSKGFVAKLTLIWPRVRMNSLVFSHQVSTLEGFGAVGTLIRPFARVDYKKRNILRKKLRNKPARWLLGKTGAAGLKNLVIYQLIVYKVPGFM